jgi:PAS domain S-box-containing protein
LAAVGTIALLAALGVIQALPYTQAAQTASDVIQATLASVSAACALAAAGRAEHRARLFWLMVAAAAASWAVGQALFTLEQTALVPLQASRLQRGLFLLAAFPMAVAGLLRPDRPGSSASIVILNVALVATGVLFLYFYIGASFEPDAAGYATWRQAASLAQLAVVSVTVFPLAFVAAPAWRTTYRTLAAATALWFGGNALLAMALLVGDYRAGLADLPWALPFVWIGAMAVAWRPVPVSPSDIAVEPWRDTRRGLTLALLAVAAVPMLHLIWTLAVPMPPDLWRARAAMTLMALVTLTLLFGWRQHGVARNAERTAAARERDIARIDARFAQAFAESPAAMLIVTPDHRLVDANGQASQLLGQSRESLVGSRLDEVMIRGEDQEDPIDRALSTGVAAGSLPLTFRTRTGTAVEALVSIEPIEAGGARRHLLLVEDVGERRGLEAELRSATRMESVGRLAAGIAHEFNNLLTAITNAGALALADVTRPAAVAAHLDRIDRASDRASTLTRQLLAFGRRQALNPEPLDLGEVVDEMRGLLPPTLGEHIRLQVDAPRGLPRVRADRAQLQQVVLHLAANARDAMPQGGHLSIAVGTFQGPAGPPEVSLTVADDGRGMSEAVQQHLFEPFFTTKELAAGGGLGLAAVYGIVTQSGGRIEVDSEPGRGTTVRILLPALTTDGLRGAPA